MTGSMSTPALNHVPLLAVSGRPCDTFLLVASRTAPRLSARRRRALGTGTIRPWRSSSFGTALRTCQCLTRAPSFATGSCRWFAKRRNCFISGALHFLGSSASRTMSFFTACNAVRQRGQYTRPWAVRHGVRYGRGELAKYTTHLDKTTRSEPFAVPS